jgi:hypothetical protein
MKNIAIAVSAVLLASFFISGTKGEKERTNPELPGLQQTAYDYELIVKTPYQMEDFVKREMAKGWQPLGGPTQGTFYNGTPGQTGLMVMQAMVKYR